MALFHQYSFLLPDISLNYRNRKNIVFRVVKTVFKPVDNDHLKTKELNSKIFVMV